MLYHVTHRKNLQSIFVEGLDRTRATGKAWRVWMCQEDKLSWALIHVAERHGWLAHDIIVIPVDTVGLPLRRFSTSGVFYSPENVPVDCLREPFVVRRQAVSMDRIILDRDDTAA